MGFVPFDDFFIRSHQWETEGHGRGDDETIRRVAGSPWNSDRRELAMQMAGEIGSSSTGRLRFTDIQVSTSGVRSMRPF